MKHFSEDNQLELDLGLEPVDPYLESLLIFLRGVSEQNAVKAVGENGGLVISFDPNGFCAALNSVRLPGEAKFPAGIEPGSVSKKKPAPPPMVEVVLTSKSLRMRSRSAYITFETGFPLKAELDEFPAEGLAFKVDPRRLDPFFSKTTRSIDKNGEIRVSRKWQPAGFDAFEYVVDEAMIVLSREEGRFGLSVVPTQPSEPLPAIGKGEGMALSTIGAFASSLIAASFVRKPSRARKRLVAVFKDGECSVVANGRGVCVASSDLDGLDITPYLNTPIKLATMLRRLDHTAQLQVMEGQALVDDGRRRCAFPIAPKTLPSITLASQLSDAGCSKWEVPNDEMHSLGALFSIFATDEPGMEMDLTTDSVGTNSMLRASMAGNAVRGRGYFTVIPCVLPAATQTRAFQKARIKVEDFVQAVAQLRGTHQYVTINSKAVILSDERDNMSYNYLLARTDLSEN